MNSFKISTDFDEYKKVFLEENAKLNLISKNEEKYLYEKHFYDSLGIKLFFKEYDYLPETLLDIGTGGGFPAIPVALEYPNIKVFGLDSIRKKTVAVKNISKKLNLNNLSIINDRVENLKGISFDLITSRAVGKIDKLVNYAYPLLNNYGYIVLYKSKNVNEEMNKAKDLIRKFHLKILPFIEYKLPTEEDYVRNLVILKKVK